MKTYRPAALRGVCSFLGILFWTLAIAVAWGSLEIGPVRDCWVEGLRNERTARGVGHALGILGVGGLFAFARLFLPLRARYEVRAAELVVHTGLLWKSTNRISIPEITHVEIASGPLMRLFGMEDLRVHTRNGGAVISAALLGLSSADRVGDLILERRAALQESAACEGYRLPSRG